MWELSLFGLLFVAVAVGWYFGRSSKIEPQQGSSSSLPHPSYYQGINYLINEQSDEGIETFIRSLDVNSETFELHIELGNLLRRRGEVDKAIRIHQNLMARPSLSKQHLNSAHLELARDYVSAGLLDRAERLLNELLNESSEIRDLSLKLLLDIYQNEKDWQKALETAEALRQKSRRKRDGNAGVNLSAVMAHFYCEQAEEALEQQNYRRVREKLRLAVAIDKDCVRASLLGAELDLSLNQPKQAIKTLKKIRSQDADFIGEALPLLQRAHYLMDDGQQLLQYLQQCLEEFPSTVLLLAVVHELESQHSVDVAADYLALHLKDNPSLKGLSKLIACHLVDADGKSKDDIILLGDLLNKLIKTKPNYQCRSCGFSGMHLHWLCPGCKKWGEMRLIKGVEGD